MDYMFWVWLVVIVITTIIEFATMEIVSIWFTLGAVIPFILAGTRAVNWVWQLAIFIALSAVLIILLRPMTKKFLLKGDNENTNTQALVGKKIRLVEAINGETAGALKVNGVVWSAVSADDKDIAKGKLVEVVKIKGNKLIVKEIKQD